MAFYPKSIYGKRIQSAWITCRLPVELALGECDAGSTGIDDALCLLLTFCLPAPGSLPLPLVQGLLRGRSFREVFPCFSSHLPLRSQRKWPAKSTLPAPYISSGSPFHGVIVCPCNLCPAVLLLPLTLHERRCCVSVAPCCPLSAWHRVQYIRTQYLFVARTSGSITFLDARCKFQMCKNPHAIEIVLEGEARELDHDGSWTWSGKVRVVPSFRHISSKSVC